MTNTQHLLATADELSTLNHELERTQFEALELQGKLLSKAARFCIEAELSPAKAKRTLDRQNKAIAASIEGAMLAGLVHLDMERQFEERADFPFDCPENASETHKPVMAVVNNAA